MSDFRERREKQLSRLEEMKQRMSQHHSGGGNNFWKPPQGRSIIRILPSVGDMEFPWQPVGRHTLGDDDKNILCPNFTSDGQLPCPICEMWDEAYRANDKEMQKRLKVRRTFQMNVVVRGIKEGEEDRGPLVWTPGVQIFEQLTEIINDPEYGDVTDPLEGFDMKVVRKGEGLDTEYMINVGRNRTPVLGTEKRPDDDGIQALLDSAIDLSKVMNDLLSYEELNAKISMDDSSTENRKNSRSADFPDDDDL